MVAQHGLERHLFGQRLAQLQLGENRRFMQPAAQVNRQQTKYAPKQKRNPPCVIEHLLSAVEAIDQGGDQRTQQNARGQAGGQGAARVANAARRHMLGHKYPGARHLTANRRTLNNPHQQQQNRRPQANLRVRRQQAHDQGRYGHHENAQGEHFLAPQKVAEVRHNDATQRSRQVTGSKNTEGLHQSQPLRHIRREKQLADHSGKKHENDEVVKLQRSAQGRKRQGLIVAAGQRARGLHGT